MIGCVAILAIGVAGYAQNIGNETLLQQVLIVFIILLAAMYVLRRLTPKPVMFESLGEDTNDMEVYRSALQAQEAYRNPIGPSTIADEIIVDDGADTEDELYLVFARLDGVKTGAQFRDRASQIIEEHDLTPLSDSEIDRLADFIDTKDLRGQSFIRTPGVAFARQVRADIDIEYAGTSWLGGTPTLGDLHWPRDENGKAMHHLAQIDLATLPISKRPEGLPETGALAFFMTTSDDFPYPARVIHIPEIGDTASEPPDNADPIYHGAHWGKFIKGHAREDAPMTFPRWPVEMIPLPMTNPNNDRDARHFIADLFPQQSASELTPSSYRDALPDFARPWFWDTAHRVANSLRIAREDFPKTAKLLQTMVDEHGEQHQPALDALLNDQVEFSNFVDEVSIWAVSHEPWDQMTIQDAHMLAYHFEQVKDTRKQKARFRQFYSGTAGELSGLYEATEATLMAAANGPPDVFACLPRRVRDDIDTKYRMASKDRWHQMFGLGAQAKTAAADHTHHHLLLQLHTDQFHNWDWDDGGVVQFWISEDALRKQDWDKIDLTIARI